MSVICIKRVKIFTRFFEKTAINSLFFFTEKDDREYQRQACLGYEVGKIRSWIQADLKISSSGKS